MSDIQKLLKMLQSKNSDDRFEACEKLRKSPTLPDEAIEALRFVTSDANSNVADAAQRALRLHTTPKSTPIESNKPSLENPNDRQRESPGIGKIIVYLTIGLFIGLITNPITSIIVWGGIGPLDAALYVFMCAPIVGAFFGATGGLIGGLLKGNKIGAVIGGLILSAISGLFPDFWYWFFFDLLFGLLL